MQILPNFMEKDKIIKEESLHKNMKKGGAVVLNSIWKSLGNLNMNSFSDRLILQKKVFLLQEMGLNLGYDFKKYIYGPYSSELAKDSFTIDIKNNSEEESLKSFFDKLKELSSGHENEPRWFELLATITYLKNKMDKNKIEIKKLIEEEKPYLSDDLLFNEAYSRLIKLKVIL